MNNDTNDNNDKKNYKECNSSDNDNNHDNNDCRPCHPPHQINHHSVQFHRHADGLHRDNQASRAQTTGGRTLLAKACWEGGKRIYDDIYIYMDVSKNRGTPK